MPNQKVPINQVQTMIDLYKSGKTLAEIGQEAGVSRQRVHQIFKKNGVTSAGNGARVRPSAKKLAQAANLVQRTARIRASWDLSLDEYDAHVAQYGSSTGTDSPMRRYIEQRRNAKITNVAWEFTFKTWWALWEQSGKWEERGVGKYVLGRQGDASTPMSPTTCKVTTVSEIICGDFFSRTPKNSAQ